MRTSDIAGWLLASALAIPFGANANPPSWLDQMAELDAQTQLIKKREELDNQLKKSASGTLEGLPSVVSIIMIDGKLQSQLYYPSGRTSYATVGTIVRQNVRVTAITEHGVEVSVAEQKRADRRLMLPFAAFNERFPATAGASAEDLSKNTALQNAVMPEPPRVNIGAPLPSGMLPAANAGAGAPPSSAAPRQ